ncbi:MAG: hypothetical protein NTV92_01280 [Candidatus Bipolaricaulota bacterium]|nr:hypothetical protein [Candidatus Bipolaricaulota bacterium]
MERTTKERWKTMEMNRAAELMASTSYVCSESVLLAVCEELGIKVDEKVIPRIGRLLRVGSAGRVPSVVPWPAA